MKKLFILLILLLQFAQSKSQCVNYQDLLFGEVPEELYRGRLQFQGMLYGNPYTLFNKSISGWNLQTDTSMYFCSECYKYNK